MRIESVRVRRGQCIVSSRDSAEPGAPSTAAVRSVRVTDCLFAGPKDRVG